MANPEINNSTPNPENPNNGFSIEVRNLDKIFNLLKDKQFQQGFMVEDDNNHCFDVLGQIVPTDNLSKSIHIELRGLDDKISFYQDYNLYLDINRQVRKGSDDRYNNPIDDEKRYFIEEKVEKLIEKLRLLGLSSSYKNDEDFNYIEMEKDGQLYILSCGPSSIEDDLLKRNNKKNPYPRKYKDVEDFLKNGLCPYYPSFGFWLKNKDIKSPRLYNQYLPLKSQHDFEKTINEFSKIGGIIINSIYQIYNEQPPQNLILDSPDPFYGDGGVVSGYRRKYNKTNSGSKVKEVDSVTVNSEESKSIVQFDVFFNKRNVEITFDSIAGQSKAVAEAKKLVLAINHPEVYEKRGVKTPKGILFYGPPGTGKTLIAKAISAEVNAELFEVSFSDIGSKWYGESEQRIQEIFDNANKVTKAGKKAIILFDELDSIAPSRNDSYEGSKKIVSIILQNLDGFRSNKDVLIIGTTNRPEDIDSALKRPGRIDKIIAVDLPNLEDRKAILKLHINKAIERSSESHDLFSKELDIQKIAEMTNGMSGAGLANIINLTLETKTVLELEGIRWTPISNADIERTLIDFNIKKEEKRKIGF